MAQQKEALGTEELVDTACDIIETAHTLGQTLKDGFQITDLGALITIAPRAQEIAKDGSTAVEQLLDLDAQEAVEVAQAIEARVGSLGGAVIPKVNEAFTLVARTYGYVRGGINLANDWNRFVRTF